MTPRMNGGDQCAGGCKPNGHAGVRWAESTWLRRKSIPSPVRPSPLTLIATSDTCSSNDSTHAQRYRQASASMRPTSFQFEPAAECKDGGFLAFINSGDAVTNDTAACFVRDNILRMTFDRGEL